MVTALQCTVKQSGILSFIFPQSNRFYLAANGISKTSVVVLKVIVVNKFSKCFQKFHNGLFLM